MGVRGRNLMEVNQNGSYISRVTGTVTDSNDTAFIVSNLSTANVTNYYSSGYLWVDGNNLWMTNANGNRVSIPNDGVNYGAVGAANAGSIWVSSSDGDYHLYYVDSSGNSRRTKAGSHYQARTDAQGVALPTVSSSYAGYIWIDSTDDHYLYFVSHNGDIARIGVGYLGAADMQ